MPLRILILLISCAYGGCAPYGPPTENPATDRTGPAGERPVRGGTARVLVGTGLDPELVRLGGLAAPLTPAGFAAALRPPLAEGESEAAPFPACWVATIDTRKTLPDGRPVSPAEIANLWERPTRADESPRDWLLAPLAMAGESLSASAGPAERLRVLDGALALCPAVPVPDMKLRLEHPALWFVRPGLGGDRTEGPGAFRGESGLTLAANRRTEDPAPYLDRIELVADQGAPGLLLRLDEADLGLVLGRDADLLLTAAGEELLLERTPRLDRTYFLWLDPSHRWVNDPRFRRWLGTVIDRDAMLRYLFAGRGEPAFRLLGGEFIGPVWQPENELPFSSRSSPRLDLAYDSSDPDAASIGARLRAAFQTRGVRIDLRPYEPQRLGAAHEGGVAAAILVHRTVTADPILDLTGSLWFLPGLPETVRQALLDGARHVSPHARGGAAGEVEARLLREARLLPLVRLHGWMVVRRGLHGVRIGPGGLLSLEQAWWSP
jgi:hypothetical protein